MFSFFKTTKNAQDSLPKSTLEERLLECDIEYDLVEKILDSAPTRVSRDYLQGKLADLLKSENLNFALPEITAKSLVWLIMGVNGAGKTTTIAKLAKIHKDSGKRVILGAGDTFRAAAVEQLRAWGENLGIACVHAAFGADPSAVAFDTISAAKARGADVALIDTAGRLENKINLKNELIKITKTCAKALNSEEFYRILVIDGTQGTQAINQARVFGENIRIDGIIITKLDGSSKGGSILSIMCELRLPVLFVGIGEGAGDLMKFEVDWYMQNLLDFVFAKDA